MSAGKSRYESVFTGQRSKQIFHQEENAPNMAQCHIQTTLHIASLSQEPYSVQGPLAHVQDASLRTSARMFGTAAMSSPGSCL